MFWSGYPPVCGVGMSMLLFDEYPCSLYVEWGLGGRSGGESSERKGSDPRELLEELSEENGSWMACAWPGMCSGPEELEEVEGAGADDSCGGDWPVRFLMML